MKQNDPIRVKKATIRLIAALLAAVVLLAVSGFGVFKMLGTPKSLTPDYSDMSVDVEGSGEPEPVSAGAQVGDYVEHEVFLVLKNFAEGYRGDTVRERYGVVPIDGKLVTFRFPQRWLESEQAIVDATQELLNGVAQYIDKYIIVRGTVQTLPENVSAELYSWFAENQEWMQQAGLISSDQDAAASLADYMVAVDQVGRLPIGAVIQLPRIPLALASILFLLSFFAMAKCFLLVNLQRYKLFSEKLSSSWTPPARREALRLDTEKQARSLSRMSETVKNAAQNVVQCRNRGQGRCGRKCVVFV